MCEGCGDCSDQSNCLSVHPLETELGLKRRIDQSSCNKDFSCVNGFCPSFVTVHGAKIRKADGVAGKLDALEGVPTPAPFPLDSDGWSSIIDGVGGTGVVTIGALLGMAAHLEGKGVTVLDMTGLAQKGGAVMSHVRLAERQEQLHSARIATGEAKLLLGCDIVVAVSEDVISKTTAGRTQAIINTGRSITGEFLRNPDREFPEGAMEQAVADAVGRAATQFLDAAQMATRLLGHSIATNIFMLGLAFQRGLVPLSRFCSAVSSDTTRPSRLATRSAGFADAEMSFDGKTLTILDKNLNKYTQIEIPGSFAHLVDVMRDKHGRPLPAADLLLSNSYDVLMEGVEDIKDLGSGVIGGVECDSLAFRSTEVDWQIWVAQGDKPYPCRYVITSKRVPNGPSYSIQFSNWKTGKAVAKSGFEFKNASKASKVDFKDLEGTGDLPDQFVTGESK